jgi:hypothetical protein
MTKKVKAKKKAVPKKRPVRGMSQREFRSALDHLGLTICGQATSKALGLGIRQCSRIAHGRVPVPTPVELLLKLYLRHGLDDRG